MSESIQNGAGFLNVTLIMNEEGKRNPVKFKYKKRTDKEKPMALDVLLQAQENELPNLAFRYGCRARNCGVCTIDINGLPRIACRSIVREGDELKAMATLPVVTDLIVRRDQISRQLKGKIYLGSGKNDLNVEASDEYHELTSCIECYACLNKCPMHEKNFEEETTDEAFAWGNPFSLLKLQTIIADPISTESRRAAAIDAAKDLGLNTCIDCPGCKCGVGIDLKGKVIKPLLQAAKLID
jgi:succinate dehydrogenase / fumarate reductase iron-sulfur subunit